MVKKKVLLKAPVLTQSGYGHNARTVLRALKAYEDVFDIYVEPINWGQCGWEWQDSNERKYIDELIMKNAKYVQMSQGQPIYDVFLHCTIPNEFERKGKVNIGITAGVESNKISPQWMEATQKVEKIIVVSEYAKYGFTNTSYEARDQFGNVVKDFKCQIPIKVVGYPVRKFEPEFFPELEQIDTDFNFLTVCQAGPRKNLPQTIEWFVQEHHDNSNVGLVVKTNIASNSIIDRTHVENQFNYLLSRYPDKKCKVYLIHGDLSDQQMAALYTHEKIKCFVGISCEGFGLSYFEASYYGLPIIAMGYSGICDFMYMPKKSNKNKIHTKAMFCEVEFEIKPIPDNCVWPTVLEKDSMWAHAKEHSYKSKLREVRTNYEKYLDMAKELQKYNCEKFTEEKVYKMWAEEIYGEQIKRVEIKDLPKVSILTSVYGSAEYLNNCLQNIVDQTVFDEKCEVLLGHPTDSPDFEKEKEIILKFVGEYPNIFYYYVLDGNPNLYTVWNYLIELANGSILTNFNTDDVRSKDNVEKCLKMLYANPDICGVYYDVYVTDKFNESMEHNSSNGRKMQFPDFDPKYIKMFNAYAHAVTFWRKDLHTKYGKFNDKYKSAADWDFANRVVAAGEKYGKLNGEPLALYCFNTQSGLSTCEAKSESKRLEEKEIYDYWQIH